MERLSFKKPTQSFDTASHPSHVTFDDGKTIRRNLPWMRFAEARWDHDAPELIQIEIGDWIVMIFGHNLGPLFVAIEEHSLLRVRVQNGNVAVPMDDTHVTQIRFVSRLSMELPRGSRNSDDDQLDLGIG